MTIAVGDLLGSIRGPEDLKPLGPSELEALAAELRDYLMRVLPEIGGHYSSNLGTVELGVALHHVYDSPHDAIVWDVSHGGYPHKLLTGRRERFETLRRDGGLSGFLCPDESEHDLARTGHAGTGLSTALGLAWARRRLGHTGRTVVVIGDGALPSGMCLEALNHVATLGLDLAILLNDNGWSIDPTPGALAGLLAGTEGREPGSFFRDLGIPYTGPIDGHDLAALVPALRAARSTEGPLLVHIRTRKGKGDPRAEADPTATHALPGSGGGRGGPTWSTLFGESIAEIAERDPRVVVISAGMLSGTGLQRFAERFPDRCHDVGIAEEHAVTFAAGLAHGGLRPVVAIYSTFLQRAYDQIVHDVCLARLPVTFVLDRGGCVGADGPTHHGMFDLAYLRHLPGMTILAPSCAADLPAMLSLALEAEGPVAIRFPRGVAPATGGHGTDPTEPRRRRAGRDAAILVTGTMTSVAVDAAERLVERGIEVEVLEIPRVKPLDRGAVLETAHRFPLVVTLEDHSVVGGFGSAVAEACGEELGARVHRIGWPDRFIEHGSTETLAARHGLDAAAVARRIEERLPACTGARRPPSAMLPRVRRSEALGKMRAIVESPLSGVVEEMCRGYRAVGARNDFIWRWVRRGLEITTLSCVPPERRDFVIDTKVLGVMLDVLLDDVADEQDDPELLECLLAAHAGRALPLADPTGHRGEYLAFTRSVADRMRDRIAELPRHDEFAELLAFDVAQLQNAMRYSALLHRYPTLGNVTEHDAFLPHNMHMVVSGTIDAMASPSFDVRELGRVREALHLAQRMGRIGNLVTTWEREIPKGDFSSDIFPLAIRRGVIRADELVAGDRTEIACRLRDSGIEAEFLAKWLRLRAELVERERSVLSVDLGVLRRGLEELIRLHLGSRGLK